MTDDPRLNHKVNSGDRQIGHIRDIFWRGNQQDWVNGSDVRVEGRKKGGIVYSDVEAEPGRK